MSHDDCICPRCNEPVECCECTDWMIYEWAGSGLQRLQRAREYVYARMSSRLEILWAEHIESLRQGQKP